MNSPKLFLRKLILTSTLSACVFLTACIPTNEKQTDEILASELIEKLMTEQNIPGISITVTKNHKFLMSKGFGFSDLETQVPVISNRTKFRIGSISKPLTANAMAQLYEAGKLDLDAPIQKYVPDFPIKKHPITVRQVAGHIAGIHHYLSDSEMLSAKRYNSVTESLNIFKNDTLLFEPGTKYLYSSYGWNLLSAVIESASGENFLDFMNRNVIEKTGLTNTTADYNDSIIPFRTRFYQLDENKKIINATYVDNSYKWAGGGFISTSEDIAKFALAHTKGGILHDTTLMTFITPQHLKNGDITSYGIGWSQGEDSNQRKYYGHTGGSVGGISVMRIYPDSGLIIVILSNSSNVRYGNLTDKIIDLFWD